MSQRVIVVGAGVVGLTCAVQLAETTEVMVDVLARDLPGENASALGPVPWLPPPARLGAESAEWARRTRERLCALASGDDDAAASSTGALAGVTMRPGRLFSGSSTPAAQLVNAPVVAPAVYLRYLTQRLFAAGGTLTRMSLPALPQRGLVVNCSGLAARGLAGDDQVAPWRWQYLRVSDPGLNEWLADEYLYVVPDGGTVALAADDEPGDDDARPDGSGLLRRAARLEPRLSGARVLTHRTALRAHRSGVQLSVRHEPERTVLHCYGHGSAGVSLSWGCAEEVARRVASLLVQTAAPEQHGLW
ncbi:MAG: FAD-dependent oxidoreductase [Kineosporiaceae bacterium]|nr:FAD-dependent oxidoreductase [Kineosporiaceae bacterium]